MKRLFGGSVANLLEILRASDAETLQTAHSAIIDRSLATLRAFGFEPPEGSPGPDSVVYLCQVADAALAFARAEDAPLQAETAAECLQAIAVFYSLWPEALDPAADSGALARFAVAASLIGKAESMTISARMGLFEQAARFDIRNENERRAGREGAGMRHGDTKARDALLGARWKAARDAGSKRSLSGWAKHIEGKSEAEGLKWRAIVEGVRRATLEAAKGDPE